MRQGISWRMLATVGFILVLIVVGVTLFLNRGPLPGVIAHQTATLIEKRVPFRVEIAEAQFHGPLRLVLNNVTLTPKGEVGITEPITVDQIRLGFSPAALLRGQPLGGLTQVAFIAPSISMDYEVYLGFAEMLSSKPRASAKRPRSDSQIPRTERITHDYPDVSVAVQKGRLELESADMPGALRFDLVAHNSASKLRIRHLEIRQGAGRLSASGTVDARGELAGRVEASDWLATTLSQYLPDLPVYGRGTVSARLKVAGTWDRPTVKGVASLQEAKLFSPLWETEEPMPIQSATVQFTFSGTSWDFDSFELLTATGELTGRGSLIQDVLNLKVKARDLRVPADIPHLTEWGVAGSVDFEGEITGTLADPLLAGRLALGTGTLWNEPISEAQGHIELTGQRFGFDEVQVQSGAACYYLEGVVSDLGGDSPDLDMHVQASEGRLEQLLSVIGVDLNARGQVDGELVFAGPFGQIGSHGKVTVKGVELYGETVEEAEGEYSWDDGEVYLRDVQARSHDGSLLVNGVVAVDGACMRLNVDLKDWSLQAIQEARLLVPGWRGRLSWSGNVEGSVRQPTLAGRLVARDLTIGQADFPMVEGEIDFDGQDLRSTGLMATTLDGGSWWLTGRVSEARTTRLLHVNVRVEEQSLSSLLAMAGHKIPAMLVDGYVHGTVQIEGTADDPEAFLMLRLAETDPLRGDSLQLDLRIADRKVKILRVEA